ncbi:MAG: hypothetical protein ABSH36_13810 [Solirubrobacteraceae bacterium]
MEWMPLNSSASNIRSHATSYPHIATRRTNIATNTSSNTHVTNNAAVVTTAANIRRDPRTGWCRDLY